MENYEKINFTLRDSLEMGNLPTSSEVAKPQSDSGEGLIITDHEADREPLDYQSHSKSDKR